VHKLNFSGITTRVKDCLASDGSNTQTKRSDKLSDGIGVDEWMEKRRRKEVGESENVFERLDKLLPT